ncbi:MAG: ABC transporter substrate-binding protein [Actinomycetota bacterium]
MKGRHFLIALGVVMLLTACGTRMPDSAFVQVEEGTVVSPSLAREGQASPGATETVAPDTSVVAGGQSPSGTTSTQGPQGSGSGSGGGTATANYASDVGVTATTITVGNITPVGGPLGPYAFSAPSHGARAYFETLNAAGGVNGRKIRFLSCDDREDPEGNKQCVRNLVEKEKAFALVANNTDAFAGAGLVNQAGVPDVGGIPVATAYYKYPTFFTIYGAAGYPRDGKNVGRDGKFYETNAPYLWYKEHLGIKKAAVLFYVVPASKNRADIVVSMLEKSGIEVVYTPNGGAGKDPASPSWDTEVINMRAAGVEAFWQVIDTSGFMNVCQAMDRYGFQVKAAVASVANWTQNVGKDFSSPCRNSIYVDANSIPYVTTSHPEVARFRAAMARYDPSYPMQQWAVEGWAAAHLFTEGVRSMSANVTRKGLMAWLTERSDRRFTNDLMTPDAYQWRADSTDFSKPRRQYICVARWLDSSGGWVAQTKPFDSYVTPWYPHAMEDDGT